MKYNNVYSLSYRFFILIFILKYYLNISKDFKETYIGYFLDFSLLLNTFLIIFLYFYFNKNIIIQKKWLILCISSILFFYHNSSINQLYFIFFIFIFNMFVPKDINSFKFIKKNMYFKIIILLSVIILSLIGIIPTIEYIRGDTLEYRNSLGFTHPNFFSLFSLSILIDYIYIKSINIKNITIIFILFLIIFEITNSRTGFLISVFLIFIVYFFEVYNINFTGKIFIILYISFISLFTILPIVYDSKVKILYFINDVLSDRLNMANEYVKLFDVTLMGEKIPQVFYIGYKSYVLDNGYILFMLSFGFLFFVIFNLINIYTLKKNKYTNKYYIIYLFVIIVIFIENIGLNPFLFSPLILEIYKKEIL